MSHVAIWLYRWNEQIATHQKYIRVPVLPALAILGTTINTQKEAGISTMKWHPQFTSICFLIATQDEVFFFHVCFLLSFLYELFIPLLFF
jgi:hypothetical protein